LSSAAHYLDDEWRQQLMPLERFIDDYVVPNRVDGYLAQTQLFEQIRAFARDIATPDYCALRAARTTTAEFDARHAPEHAIEQRMHDALAGGVSVHAWFGPGGTVSPCHHDPANNLLCQVVGVKRVRLFDHRHTDAAVSRTTRATRMRWNSSSVQPTCAQPDLARFPARRRGAVLRVRAAAGRNALHTAALVARRRRADALVLGFVLVSLSLEFGLRHNERVGLANGGNGASDHFVDNVFGRLDVVNRTGALAHQQRAERGGGRRARRRAWPCSACPRGRPCRE
jgi:hypothetical protein